jgi:hypothetical protein
MMFLAELNPGGTAGDKEGHAAGIIPQFFDKLVGLL